jgi:predicted CxxxxCH...CXXCH cytochrome family protein
MNFKPSLFDREAHMRSAFSLVGKHSSLRCAQCHQPEGREARYKTDKLICTACHAEPHGGEFAAEPYGDKCDLCHTPAGFEATTFSVERHARTQFPLTGRHAEVACSNCHKPLAGAISKGAPEIAKVSYAAPTLAADGKSVARDARRQYHFPSHGCNSCHTDPHEITPRANLLCATCHVTQQWKALRPFDHSFTRFKLEGSHLDGAHQPIACVRCHKASGQAGSAAARIAPVFSGTPTQCSGCHNEKDAHGGQFNSLESPQKDCSYCHIPVGWNGSDFDHDRARFTLSAVHRKVECAKCHKEQKEVNGKMVRAYRDTPTDCLKCH